MSKPSKPGLSFGLSLKKAPSKPAPAKRKPATFGDDDDDDVAPPSAFTGGKAARGKEPLLGGAPAVQEVAITELDALSTSQPPAAAAAAAAGAPPSPTIKKPKSSRPAAAPPPPPKLSSAGAGSEQPPHAQFGDLSSALSSRKHAEAAASLDPSIYDYDSVYDSLKAAAQKRKEAAKAAEEEERSRPRYMASVLSAAAVRERDRLVAEEKRLAREREAEGEEFRDKEKFVTEAYRRQQEEVRRLEEEERVREEEERRKNKGRGMSGWYKDMLDRGEREHGEVLKAVEETLAKKKVGEGRREGGGEEEKGGEEAKTEEELARELLQKGKKITINEDGQIVDKRELLQGGLNVGAKKKAEALREKSRLAAGPGTQQQSKGGVYVGGKQAMRERQTRMLEAQLEESLKRAREEEEEEKKTIELVAKSRKTEADISSAKERYLARKRAAEEARKNGTADGP